MAKSYMKLDGDLVPISFGTASGGGDTSIHRAANKSLFPTIGDNDTIYIANDTQKIYTWNGLEYVLNGSKDSMYIGETTPSNKDYTQWFKPVEVDGIESIETLSIIEEVPEYSISELIKDEVPEYATSELIKDGVPEYNTSELINESVPEFGITKKEEDEVPEFKITSI